MQFMVSSVAPAVPMICKITFVFPLHPTIKRGQAEKNSGDSPKATQTTTCCCSFQVCKTKVKDYIYPAFLSERKEHWLQLRSHKPADVLGVCDKAYTPSLPCHWGFSVFRLTKKGIYRFCMGKHVTAHAQGHAWCPIRTFLEHFQPTPLSHYAHWP